MDRIHIVGTGPRTGTTLLHECMISSFEIDAFEEHEAPVWQHRHNAGVYLTKDPDVHVVGPRLVVDRHFYVIAMLRDPRDIVVSVHGQHPQVYWVPLRFWKDSIKTVRTLVHCRRFIVVRYEHLVRDPDAVQDMLRRKMPFLKIKSRFSDFHKFASPSLSALHALGGLRPICTDSIGNWRNHLPRLAGQLLIHGPISQELIDLGYETDDGWLSLLQGVEADLAPSHWPEVAPVRSWKTWTPKYVEAAKIAAARFLGIALV
jgi:hypothetical protein